MQRKTEEEVVGREGSKRKLQSSKEHFDTPVRPPDDTFQAAKISRPDKSVSLICSVDAFWVESV